MTELESYDKSKDSQQSRQTQREQRQAEQRQESEHKSATLAHGMQRLRNGAKLQDLSPEEAREVAAVIGNQAVLQLLHGGEESVPLAHSPPGRQTEEALPETAVDIRWPILTALPTFDRSGPIPQGVFPIEHLRTMGSLGEGGVVPDG